MDEERRKEQKFKHKIFKLTILIIVLIFFYLIYSFFKIGFFKGDKKDFNFDENQAIYYTLLKNDPNFFYIHDSPIIVEKCDTHNFYINNLSKSIPCIIENKSSPFYEKANFVLTKSKVLETGFLELKKLLDLGNIEDRSPSYFKKELTGIMNILGTPKFSQSLSMEDMWMEFVYFIIHFFFILNQSTKNYNSNTTCDSSEYLYFIIEGTSEINLAHIYTINSLNPYREEGITNNNKIGFREIKSEANLEKVKKDKKDFPLYTAKLKKGDILFVPAYFFKQQKVLDDINSSIIYRFRTHSRVLNSLMITLFDNVTEDF